MYCPECGNDAGDARFCPECGANLAGVQDALHGKSSGGKGDQAADAAAPAPARRGLSPAVIWGIFGAVAVVVIVIVVMVSGGFGGSGSNDGSTAASSSGAVPVGVTSGSYDELVQKANDFYDKGDAAFQKQDFTGGGEYFQAAAMTYAAAWQKKKADPGVGTDFATSLFYSGNIDAALSQIKDVIKQFPDYQAAYYNLGNYLSHKARIAEQDGDKKAAKADTAAAKEAYTKAVAIDPKSDVGKQADASLQAL
jgi:tetratricopeptide (TPR) repeat protein